MSKDKTKFSVAISIKREDENALVYYKQDGERFEYNCTIKLNVETVYKFLLVFRPPQKLKSASLKGTLLEVNEEESTSDSSSYSLVWTSNNACISKNNRRDHFPLSLTIQSLGTLDLTFQFKFYKSDDNNHSVWGNALHHIEYDCIYKSATSSCEIEKEVYRYDMNLMENCPFLINPVN